MIQGDIFGCWQTNENSNRLQETINPRQICYVICHISPLLFIRWMEGAGACTVSEGVKIHPHPVTPI